ncbi:MAG: MbtH family NRPS accessory protein [Steroidobacteraceae bacterium]
MSWGDENTSFAIVKNHEEQYSLWPTFKPIPDGWSAVGKNGNKAECLAYIDATWTDMRPLSLRKAMRERQEG